MAKINGKTKAWLSQYSSVTPQQIEDGTAKINSFHLSNVDFTDQGYTYVGEAEIALTTFDATTVIENKVQALREQAKGIRAEATMKCAQIEDQIKQLLAISYDSASSGTA